MGYELTRWAQEKAPSREEIESLFERESLSPYSWANGPGDTYAAHTHGYHKVLYCVKGGITFTVQGEDVELGREDVELGPGDRLELTPGTLHAARVGSKGVTCLEAHRP